MVILEPEKFSFVIGAVRSDESVDLPRDRGVPGAQEDLHAGRPEGAGGRICRLAVTGEDVAGVVDPVGRPQRGQPQSSRVNREMRPVRAETFLDACISPWSLPSCRAMSVTSAPRILFLFVTTFVSSLSAADRQLTTAPHGHVLTNVNVWSPDSRWIVYDVRAVDSVFDGTRIEQVDVETGEVQRLYESKHRATCGVVTYHPREPRVIFIHGPENPSPDWTYGMTRRRGAMVDGRHPGVAQPLDAMVYAPPFTPGALRGGSHVHVFSPDGGAVSFTYEDEVLAQLGPTGDHDLNQRNIGVSVPVAGGVKVARTHPRSHDGDWFTVVVSRTVNHPRPGSDEISRAFEEGWVPGPSGRRALAFLGNVTAPDGREHAEVFLLELPADLTQAGDSPLEGTATRRPAPPRGVTQRRLTFTTGRKFPGVATTPRHWLRAAPDGSQIAFLMKDDAGVVQLWTVPPRGGAPRQVTRHATAVTSAFTWSPDSRRIAHTLDGSVFVTEIATGRSERLTPGRAAADSPEPFACVYSPDGRRIAYTRRVVSGDSSHSQIFVVPVSPP